MSSSTSVALDTIGRTDVSTAPTYEPISSVWEGSDGELLEAMFSFYAVIPVEPILDATYNAGRFWKGSTRDVVSMDIDPQYKTAIVGDNRKMKVFHRQNLGSLFMIHRTLDRRAETRVRSDLMWISAQR
jgi:hypothetical protein